MTILRSLTAGAFLFLAFSTGDTYAGPDKDRELLQKTSEGIRSFNKQMELLDFYSGIRPVDRPPTEQA